MAAIQLRHKLVRQLELRVLSCIQRFAVSNRSNRSRCCASCEPGILRPHFYLFTRCPLCYSFLWHACQLALPWNATCVRVKIKITRNAPRPSEPAIPLRHAALPKSAGEVRLTGLRLVKSSTTSASSVPLRNTASIRHCGIESAVIASGTTTGSVWNAVLVTAATTM